MKTKTRNHSSYLYFAYGSNMSTRRLQARTPSARFQCIATLSGHVLKFHKKSHDGSAKCDAFKTDNPEDTLIGICFEIDRIEKPALDQAEGLGKGYEIKTVTLQSSHGRTIEAELYYATDIDTSLLPYHWYKHHVIKGAIEHDLPADYLAQLNRIQSVDDTDSERHKAQMQIYNE